MTSLQDRYRGCLLGLACGDALGGPVEFMDRAAIRAVHPDGLRDFVGGGWLRLAPGEITDDTQMTLALARSLADGTLDMDDVSARFLAWYRSRPKDIGNLTRASLAYLDRGERWDVAGARALADSGGEAAGNGSVMRCAPVALRFRTDLFLLDRASIDTSRVTHAHPRCTAGCVAVNRAIAHLLDGGDKAGAFDDALVGIADPETRSTVSWAPLLAEPDVPNGGYVLSTATAAFWALLNHDGLEATIVAAVALGGDADTNGAVAGALAGACYGAAAIPDRWLSLLQPRAELEELADRLLELSLAG